MCFVSGGCESSTHKCTCSAGWTGLGCEIADCPGEPDCNARGSCNSTTNPPHCNCTNNYMGHACEKLCLKGNLVPPGSSNCVCQPGWVGTECDSECSGHGAVDATTNTCTCIRGWRGSVCDTPGCPGIGTDCSGHGECNAATHVCDCEAGWTGDGCEIADCPGNPDCNNRGRCDASQNTPRCMDCHLGWMGPACDEPCVNGAQVSTLEVNGM